MVVRLGAAPSVSSPQTTRIAVFLTHDSGIYVLALRSAEFWFPLLVPPQLLRFQRAPSYCYSKRECLYFLFLPANVSVWLLQFGQRNLRFSNRLSLSTPLIWSKTNDRGLSSHFPSLPHITHSSGRSFLLRILYFKAFRLKLEFSQKTIVSHLRARAFLWTLPVLIAKCHAPFENPNFLAVSSIV